MSIVDPLDLDDMFKKLEDTKVRVERESLMPGDSLFPSPENLADPPRLSLLDHFFNMTEFNHYQTEEQMLGYVTSNRDLLYSLATFEYSASEMGIIEAARALAVWWDISTFQAAICFLDTALRMHGMASSTALSEISRERDVLGAALHVIGRRYCQVDGKVDSSILPFSALLLTVLAVDLERAHDRYLSGGNQDPDPGELTSGEIIQLEQIRKRLRPPLGSQ